MIENYLPKNHMLDICSLLGVSLEERFRIDDRRYLYWLSLDGLHCEYSESPFEMRLIFTNLLIGCSRIIKLPWCPKLNERYFTYYLTRDNELDIDYYYWGNTIPELALYKAGWVFKTKEEALEALPVMADAEGIPYSI